MSWRVGESVTCEKCGRTKQPRGRSVPMEMANGMCSWECPGYVEAPPVGDLWPGERREDFGYPEACPVCELPTELLGIPDPAAAIAQAREALERMISRAEPISGFNDEGDIDVARAARAALAERDKEAK